MSSINILGSGSAKSKDKSKQDKSEDCLGCGNKVKKGDSGLNCELCNNWFHCSCENIKDEVYNVLKTTHSGIHWYCKGCDRGVFNILKSLTEMEERQKNTETEMNKMKEEAEKQSKGIVKLNKSMKELEEKLKKKEEEQKIIEEKQQEIDKIKISLASMDEQMKKHTVENKKNIVEQETLWSDIVNKHVDKKLGTVQNEVERVQKTLQEAKKQAFEERDKESRRNNIIIYKAAESDAGSVEERHKEDKEFCYHLFREILEIDCNEGEMKKIIRLGVKQDKERPILIEFAHRDLKNMVMESLRKLRTADDKFKRLSIVHDMTKIERDEIKLMVAEAKEEQEQEGSGEWIYRVRGAPGSMRIVKIKRI